MKVLTKFLFCLCVFLTCFACADTPTLPTPSQNYQVIDKSKLPNNFAVPPHRILVYDFFSYGCPHCYYLNPYIEQWLTQNAAPYIVFQAVPVAFDPGWDFLSKAYHIASILGIEKSLHDQIFDIAQNPLLGIGSDAQLRGFFLNHGVTAADYDRVAHGSALQQALQNDQALIKTFNIIEIPAMIIANEKTVYYISNRTVANADPRVFIATLTNLTSKRP